MKQSATYYLSPTRSKALVDSQRARAQYRNHYARQVREVVSARRLLTLVDEARIDRAAMLATYLRYIRPALRDADPNGWDGANIAHRVVSLIACSPNSVSTPRVRRRHSSDTKHSSPPSNADKPIVAVL